MQFNVQVLDARLSHPVFKAMSEIGLFVINAINEIDPRQVDRLVSKLEEVYRDRRKVLVMGAGRSGLVGKAFAMRLLHLGFNSYVLGETIVPSVRTGDLVIAISGSGRTKLIVTAAETAKQVGATVAALTTFQDSPLGKLADIVVRIPGRTKMTKMDDYFARQILGIHEPLAPLGTLFEDTAIVFLDGVIYSLMKRLGIDEEYMRNMHANVEL
ncbi:MAG: 6-phospho-3-hexuloisomerase [Aeropyrum sp.]|nr:6-phospho-3-hexuloisomerase [Aeropyrum sp.]MCE4616323.1 6-phospho-3-hexuloisomerase [Aeropyrum sp.]